MDEEKSLLQQIRDKEIELSAQLDAVKKETDALIAGAKDRADRIIREADESGKRAAEDLFRAEKEKIDREVEKIRSGAAAEAGAVGARGAKNLDTAVDRVVGHVIRT